uniref:Restriction endonuclease S subunit n=1 Tax=Candidatus Kentrum eta TaxID=2126337 RepID=A0A450UXS5_9GAMM|nr:MAG: Restriction endonuclease S subunit [Candidatus Kentron sp. H]VFJ97791.1 MAG: Restriction endonuclease S subunit [Candidatus Kentron sp. H]VFK03241.1 MAG: Restriction endonuclease S subunit [Candidatus Kentron sp. H]
MMNTQLVVPLSNLMDIKHGYPFSSRYFVDRPTEYILLTPGNFTKDRGLFFGPNTTYYDGPVSDEFILKDGDLLMVMTDLTKDMAILGNTAILSPNRLGKQVLHNQRIGKVIHKGRCANPMFLMYLLNSHAVRKEIKTTATGTTVRHTSPNKILNIKVWAPEIFEQEEIANILSKWDRAVSLMERLITANQQRREGLVQRLLSGKLRIMDYQYPCSWERCCSPVRSRNSGPCPVDWDYPCLGEIARPITERNKDNGGGDKKQLPVLSCTKHKGLVDSSSYFSKQIFGKDLSLYKVVRRGRFAYATNHLEEGSIGYQELYDEALVSPMYTVFETLDRVLDKFLYLVLKTNRYRHIFAVNTNASVNRRGSLRWKEFARIRVPLPPKEEQEILIRVFSTVDREIALLRKQQLALWQQKQGLMQKLLSGEWRVPVSGK